MGAPPRLPELSTREAAEYCNYKLRTFYTRVAEIPHRKDRRRLYFTIPALDEFKASQSVDHVPTKGAA